MGDTHTGGDALDTLDTPNTIDALDAADAFQLPPRSPCTTHLQPTGVSPDAGAGDDDITVQTALILANAGDVICFDDGNYYFSQTLTLNTRNITLQGTASNAVLDFTAQTIGSDSIHITGDQFTIQYLTIQNYQGNGIKADGPTGVTFRAIHAHAVEHATERNSQPVRHLSRRLHQRADRRLRGLGRRRLRDLRGPIVRHHRPRQPGSRQRRWHRDRELLELRGVRKLVVQQRRRHSRVRRPPGCRLWVLAIGHVYDNQVYSNNTNSMGFATARHRVQCTGQHQDHW